MSIIAVCSMLKGAFRHIKSNLKIRPIYHYRRWRGRAHVLICFFCFYLLKKMELELRKADETKEIELLLRRWVQLQIVEQQITVGEQNLNDWQWLLGEIGQGIQAELQAMGWWQSIDAYRRSRVKLPDLWKY